MIVLRIVASMGADHGKVKQVRGATALSVQRLLDSSLHGSNLELVSRMILTEMRTRLSKRNWIRAAMNPQRLLDCDKFRLNRANRRAQEALGRAAKRFRIGLARGQRHWDSHVAIQHTSGAFHQVIESPEGVGVPDDRAEVGPTVHSRFDDESTAKGLLSA